MKKYLTDLVDEYIVEDIDGVHPISEEDAEIIELLISIASVIKHKKLQQTLKKWKTQPDSTTVEDLLNLQQELESGTQAGYTVDYVQIKNLTIKVSLIASIEPLDDYDITKRRPVYKLILNRDERSKIVFANAEVEFSSAEERGREYDRLRERLREFTNIRFL